MRMLKKNKQKLYYSLFIEERPKYALDEFGEKIIEYVDKEGNVYYRETGEMERVYSLPIEFYGNISMSGGEAEAVEFGLNMADYEAVLIVSKGLIPVDETSFIWFDSEPVINNDIVDWSTADYSIIKLSHSLNVDKYVLRKNVK